MLSLCSGFCPLGSVAAWILAGDWLHLWLITISNGYEAAAPEHLRWTVSLSAESYQTNSDRMSPGSSGLPHTCVFPVSKVATFPVKSLMTVFFFFPPLEGSLISLLYAQ